MKGSIKRGIPVAICLFSLLLCRCANQQQEKNGHGGEPAGEKKVTQGLVTEGTCTGGRGGVCNTWRLWQEVSYG